jgi:hypothetical protein
MGIIIGLVLGIVFTILGIKIKNTLENTKRRIDGLENNLYEKYYELSTSISDLKAKELDNSKIKILKEEIGFTNKSNGLNFQKVFNDIIKLNERITHISNK